MDKDDLSKITKIIEKNSGQKPIRVYHDGDNLRFKSLAGEKNTEKACQALLAAGLQSTPDDGNPEYYKTGHKGADLVSVRWPLDIGKPIWNK